MGNFKYVSNRTFMSKAGQEAGRIKVMVKNGSEKLEGSYTCPECGHEGEVDQAFRRPISVKCDACKFTIKLLKMKGKS